MRGAETDQNSSSISRSPNRAWTATRAGPGVRRVALHLLRERATCLEACEYGARDSHRFHTIEKKCNVSDSVTFLRYGPPRHDARHGPPESAREPLRCSTTCAQANSHIMHLTQLLGEGSGRFSLPTNCTIRSQEAVALLFQIAPLCEPSIEVCMPVALSI